MRRISSPRAIAVTAIVAIVLPCLLILASGHPFGFWENSPASGSPVTTTAEPAGLESPSPSPVAVTSAEVLPSPTATPSPTPESTVAQLAHAVPPERDLYDLTKRLRPGADANSPTPGIQPADLPIGHQEVFWLDDMTDNTHFQASATLRLRTTHAYFYVTDGIDVGQADLERAGRDFEEKIFPKVTGYYGDKWGPDPISGDPRLTIVIARTPGVGGYFSSADEYPKTINRYSNERSIIYVSGTSARPGTDGFSALLAHEFQHALHWRIDGHEQTWVSEGSAELAADLAGYGVSTMSAFLDDPNTQLNSWTESRDDARKHYGAAYLFMKYFSLHYGGYGALKDFLTTPGHGEQKFNSYLAQKGYALDFDHVFADWIVANYLDQPGDGPFSYPDATVQVRPLEKISVMGRRKAQVNQYAARYFDLQPSANSFRLHFVGNAAVSLLQNEPHSGSYEWWSNRADNMDSTLTKSFDLSGVSSAMLHFWTWYDIENTWDNAYVEVSADSGQSWNVLRGTHATDDDLQGNSYGPAYTGLSGGGRQPIWVEEGVDLSPYAGKQILLRFEYVTDESTSLQGLALDDITIPEIGFSDDAEANDGWQASGFIRTDNVLPQEYAARLIKIGRQVTVEDLPLDASQTADVTVQGLGQDFDRLILVVGAMAPDTVQPANFEITLSPN